MQRMRAIMYATKSRLGWRHKSKLVVAIALLGSSMLAGSAQATGETDPVQMLTRYKVGIGTVEKARAYRTKLMRKIYHGACSMRYSDGSGRDTVPFLHTNEKKWAAIASFENREAMLAAQSPENRRYWSQPGNLGFVEGQIQKADEMIRSLPKGAVGGFKLGPSIYKNRWILASGHRMLITKLHRIADKLERFGKLSAEKAEKCHLKREEVLHQVLDNQYIAERPRIARRLQEIAPETLFNHALTLISEINAVAHRKSIRKEEIGRGQSESSSSRTATARGRSVQFAKRGHGRLQGYSKFDSSEHSHSRSSSSWSWDQLLTHAASYEVDVRNLSGRMTNDKALTPPEARLLVATMIELEHVTHALEKRAPKIATPLKRWLEHSDLTFCVPRGGGYYSSRYGSPDYRSGKDNKYKVQLGHTRRDAIGLVDSGVVSERMANELNTELQAPLSDRLARGGSTLLGD